MDINYCLDILPLRELPLAKEAHPDLEWGEVELVVTFLKKVVSDTGGVVIDEDITLPENDAPLGHPCLTQVGDKWFIVMNLAASDSPAYFYHGLVHEFSHYLGALMGELSVVDETLRWILSAKEEVVAELTCKRLVRLLSPELDLDDLLFDTYMAHWMKSLISSSYEDFTEFWTICQEESERRVGHFLSLVCREREGEGHIYVDAGGPLSVGDNRPPRTGKRKT